VIVPSAGRAIARFTRGGRRRSTMPLASTSMPSSATSRCSLTPGPPGVVACQAMAPVFEQAVAELEPEVRLIKVDSDAVPGLLQRYGIQSIPTLMLVHHDREIARQSGAIPLPRLLAWTREHAEGVKV